MIRVPWTVTGEGTQRALTSASVHTSSHAPAFPPPPAVACHRQGIAGNKKGDFGGEAQLLGKLHTNNG
jgi:hypothetical protein